MGLTEAALIRHLDALVNRLKAAGYKPRTRNQYLGIWKSIARERAHAVKEAKKAETAEEDAAGLCAGRYVVREKVLPGADNPAHWNPYTGKRRDDAPPLDKTDAIFDTEKLTFLTNFNLTVQEEIEIHDQFERRKVFRCKLSIYGREVPLEIDAKDYADDKALRAIILETAGSQPMFYAKMAPIREAVSTLSWAGERRPARRVVTTDFGWTPSGDAYLVPGGRITAQGFEAACDQTACRVDLTGEELAQHLDLQAPLSEEELRRVKRHIVQDLLRLHHRRITFSLLAAVAVALLAPFAPAADLFALWLVGLTGAGKTLLAKLFMNFFGDFPVTSGRFGAWAATANYIQRQGFFFKNALYLVDDYKPELVSHYQVQRVLQNYADRTGRGRLKADATTNTSRPIRGQLLSTGEDVPEHTASALARSIIIEVPQTAKDQVRRDRCMDESRFYSAVTGDFIRYILANGRTGTFARNVQEGRNFYYRGIVGEQNDMRIAGNFGLLGSALMEIAEYFGDVWPEWWEETRRYLQEDLVDIRNAMAGAVQEQQASEVFWTTLADLVEHNIYTIDHAARDEKNVIGKPAGPSDLYWISTNLALAAVNKCLREQGRPELRVTPLPHFWANFAATDTFSAMTASPLARPAATRPPASPASRAARDARSSPAGAGSDPRRTRHMAAI